jgi:pimeloyl-ACP methyl ester carboxylesterase
VARLLRPQARPTTPWRARRADDDYGETAAPDWRQVDWAAHLHRVELSGRDVNYVDLGSGEGLPVVFVHGLGGQWQNWLENIPRVAQERRVLALDLPGFGLSEMPRDRITITGYGKCVDAFCEALGLGRVVLVGNSMGGFISSEVAIQFPERVERLVLVSAAGITTANLRRAPVLLAARIATAVTAYTAARHEAIARRPVSRHVALALVARHPSRIKSDLAWEGLFKGTGKPGFDDALRASLEYDFQDRLGETRAPTLIVWGENDTILPARDAREFERLIPQSRTVVMEDTGHVPQLERPTIFNDLLLDFLGEGSEAARPEEASAA